MIDGTSAVGAALISQKILKIPKKIPKKITRSRLRRGLLGVVDLFKWLRMPKLKNRRQGTHLDGDYILKVLLAQP